MEADGVDADAGVAWSVVVKGQATALERTQEVLDTVGLLLFPWETGRKDHFIQHCPGQRERETFHDRPAAVLVESAGRRHPGRAGMMAIRRGQFRKARSAPACGSFVGIDRP